MTIVSASRRAGKSTLSMKRGIAAIELMEDPDKLKATISVLMAGHHLHKDKLLGAARDRLKKIESRDPKNVVIPEPDMSDAGGAV